MAVSFQGTTYETPNGRLEVTCTGAETDGALHEMRATYAAGSPFPPPHLHPDQDERFEVLAGAMTFVVDGEEQLVAAGDHIDVPRTAEFHDAVQTATASEDWSGLRAALREYRDVFRLVPDPFADG